LRDQSLLSHITRYRLSASYSCVILILLLINSTQGSDEEAMKATRINELQLIGSHNSYKQSIRSGLMTVLQWLEPEIAEGLDYNHAALEEQLALGLRVFELDLFHDPEGGRYATPIGRWFDPLQGTSTEASTLLNSPGLKVQHVQDIDFRSHCVTLKVCLSIFKSFSQVQPNHLPIFISLNLKTDPIQLSGAAVPLPFDVDAFHSLHSDIVTTLGEERVITPSEVQGSNISLRAKVTTDGWPPLDQLRGRFLFLVDEKLEKTALYLKAFGEQERLLFLNLPPEHDQAAILIMNHPDRAFDAIQDLVHEGYLVRTRADADTREARTEDAGRMQLAFDSGAQFISTDYYQPDPRFGGRYQVVFPDGRYVRENPVYTSKRLP
jgi:hypothetical protein